MGFLDSFLTPADWDGDGKITSADEAMEMLMIQNNAEAMEREERIETVVRAITWDGVSKTINNRGFEDICRQHGLNVDDFTREDICEIQRRLNRY